MSVNAPRLRLATQHGRRVGRTTKAKQLAAQPGTDAARFARSLSEIYSEGCHVLACAQRAEEVGRLAFSAACRDEPITTGALTRESYISAGHVASRISNLLQMMEQAGEGTLCA